MLYDIYENGFRLMEHLLPEVAADVLGISERELAERVGPDNWYKVGTREVRRANRRRDEDGYYVADLRLETSTRRPRRV